MRAALARRQGAGVLLAIVAVAVLLAVIANGSMADGGGDAAKFSAAANKACATADKALARLNGRDPGAQSKALDDEYATLRALTRPSNQIGEIGQFITARGRERTQTKLAARRVRQRLTGQTTTSSIVVAGTSASLASRLRLTECAKRGLPGA